ncbi:MAG: hypothetical protein U0X20_07540 [Caldilineaceae bacterium]
MSLRNMWSGDQRRNLISQLCSTSRAFTVALPAEEAVDGLIMNLHLCLALDLSTEEVQEIFGRRTLTFLVGMISASQTESVSPQYKLNLKADLFCERPLVETRIGTIGPDGRLRDEQNGLDNETINIVFRSRPGGQTP